MAKTNSGKFKVGDVVELISGGPPMTVTFMELTPSGTVYCSTSWFAAKKNETARFPEDALKPHKTASGDGDVEK